jgi:hypothetical protein
MWVFDLPGSKAHSHRNFTLRSLNPGQCFVKYNIPVIHSVSCMNVLYKHAETTRDRCMSFIVLSEFIAGASCTPMTEPDTIRSFA